MALDVVEEAQVGMWLGRLKCVLWEWVLGVQAAAFMCTGQCDVDCMQHCTPKASRLPHALPERPHACAPRERCRAGSASGAPPPRAPACCCACTTTSPTLS